ncbi:MAG: hypothetical protein CMJ23_08620 [Phycisphaerae bacterium]|nr:hypothetical protein [Phycisphaerae bacterium]
MLEYSTDERLIAAAVPAGGALPPTHVPAIAIFGFTSTSLAGIVPTFDSAVSGLSLSKNHWRGSAAGGR